MSHGLRTREVNLFKEILNSSRAELVAIYGRRRIGKTYLVRNYFQNKGLYLEVIGQNEGTLERQLELFTEAFSKTFYGGVALKRFESWNEAFSQLSKEIDRNKKKKVIVFMDELPWLATKKSNLLQALDHEWNSSWSQQKNAKIILCGSAASWMLEKLVYAKGGLHNRLTYSIPMRPFTLAETESYLKLKKIRMNRFEILELYMALGGVAFYLDTVRGSESVLQNINRICFDNASVLFNEFEKLFRSLFSSSEKHLAIFNEIASHHYGLTRKQLLEKLKLPSGGQFNKVLSELKEAGFVEQVQPFGAGVSKMLFRATDEYSIFYQTWISKAPKGIFSQHSPNYWSSLWKKPKWNSWNGYVFENICLKHSASLAKHLGISGIHYRPSIWISKDGQIDLIFDREDGVIQLFEIKYVNKEFEITESYAKHLQNRIENFRDTFKTRKRIILTFITPHGVKKNFYAGKIVDSELAIDSLF